MKWLRLRGLLVKESLQVIRDPSAIGIAFVMPLVLLLLFGYGVSLDAYHVRIAVVDEHPSQVSQALVAGLQQSPYFLPMAYRTQQEASQAMLAHRVEAVLVLREDFSRQWQANQYPTIDLTVNGVDANTAGLVEGYMRGIWQTWLNQERRWSGHQQVQPVELQTHIWFNPAMRSRNYLVPGLVAIIMTLIGALLTALVVAREWERGTMEALMATPVTMEEILLGKLIPYFVLGMGGMVLAVSMARWLFEVPMIGSVLQLVISSTLFMLVALSMGLLISSVARNQFVAAQVAVIVTYLPAFILSGFIFDIRSMPVLVGWLTHLVAARYFVTLLQSLFLAGDIPKVLWVNDAALLLMALVLLGLIGLKNPKTLD